MYVCMYVCIYIYRCMYAYMYTFVCINIRWFHSVRFICKYFCAYTCMGFGTHRKFALFVLGEFNCHKIYKHTRTHSITRALTSSLPNPCTRALARAHTHTHTHTSTHTQDMELEERLLEVEQVTYRMCNMYTYINAHKRKHTHTHTHTQIHTCTRTYAIMCIHAHISYQCHPFLRLSVATRGRRSQRPSWARERNNLRTQR